MVACLSVSHCVAPTGDLCGVFPACHPMTAGNSSSPPSTPHITFTRITYLDDGCIICALLSSPQVLLNLFINYCGIMKVFSVYDLNTVHLPIHVYLSIV